MRFIHPITALILGLNSSLALAGPYAPAAGQPGSTAIAMGDPAIAGWATGWQDYVPGSDVDATWQTPDKALGAAAGDSYDVVSLGRGGRITLSFSGTLFDGPGYDFAVFENGFSDTFLELAWVEVSSDGVNYVRFPGVSFTPAPVSAFGSLDPTDITGFAGKYRQGFGTPFDLQELAGTPGLDTGAITHVRLVDIVGDGSELDSYAGLTAGIPGGPFPSHPIYDPYPTTGSAGFDLDAVAALHLAAVPLPPALLLLAPALLLVLVHRKTG